MTVMHPTSVRQEIENRTVNINNHLIRLLLNIDCISAMILIGKTFEILNTNRYYNEKIKFRK